MVLLNGNTEKVKFGISVTITLAVLFLVAFSYLSNEENKKLVEQARIQSIQNNKDIDRQSNLINKFIIEWDRRQNETQTNLENITDISNEQELQLLDLAHNQSKILKTQIENEQNIIDTENHLIGNLTDHRVISNITRDIQLEAINQTKQLVQFLSDNFGEESGYLEKENFQYDQANKTFGLIEHNNELLHELINKTNDN